jgi:hypothetical protein
MCSILKQRPYVIFNARLISKETPPAESGETTNCIVGSLCWQISLKETKEHTGLLPSETGTALPIMIAGGLTHLK